MIHLKMLERESDRQAPLIAARRVQGALREYDLKMRAEYTRIAAQKLSDFYVRLGRPDLQAQAAECARAARTIRDLAAAQLADGTAANETLALILLHMAVTIRLCEPNYLHDDVLRAAGAPQAWMTRLFVEESALRIGSEFSPFVHLPRARSVAERDAVFPDDLRKFADWLRKPELHPHGYIDSAWTLEEFRSAAYRGLDGKFEPRGTVGLAWRGHQLTVTPAELSAAGYDKLLFVGSRSTVQTFPLIPGSLYFGGRPVLQAEQHAQAVADFAEALAAVVELRTW